MPTNVMTSLYRTPAQKRALARRAQERRHTVSEEILTAVDKRQEKRGRRGHLSLVGKQRDQGGRPNGQKIG